MRRLFIALALVFVSPQAYAIDISKQSFHAYVASGRMFGLSSVRVGYKNFELGKLGPLDYGIGSMFGLGDSVIATFGLAAFGNGVGLYGSMGWEPHLFSVFYFRAEAMAVSHWEGAGSAEVLVGLATSF